MELDPEKAAFVNAVMAPLGDKRSQLEILTEAVALASPFPQHPKSDSDQAATARMIKTAGGFDRRRKLAGSLLIIILLAGAWLSFASPGSWRSLEAIWHANLASNAAGTLCCETPGVPRFPIGKYETDAPFDNPFYRYGKSRLGDESTFIVLGDGTQDQEGRQWKPVWDSHSKSPAHYMAYSLALAYKAEESALPEDFVETGERLDPDNGMFRLMNAATRLKHSIGEEPDRRTRVERIADRNRRKSLPSQRFRIKPKKPKRIVLDEAAFSGAWRDLEESLIMPKLSDYRAELNHIRESEFPTPVDFTDVCVFQMMAYAQPEDSAAPWIVMKNIEEAFSLAAEKAAKSGNLEQLKSIDEMFRRAVRRLAESSSGLMPSFITRIVARKGASGLATAWHQAENHERAAQLEKFAADLDLKRHPAPAAAPDALTESRGSNLALQGAAYLKTRNPSSAPVTEDQLRGGRLAEYAMYERLMAHGMAALFCIILLFLLGATPRKLGKLPARLSGLITAQDRLLIGLIGVALPVAFYLLATRSSFLSSKDFNLSHDRFLMWLIQCVALITAITGSVLLTMRWRLSMRAAILPNQSAGSGLGRFCLPMTLITLIAAPLLPPLIKNSPLPEDLTLACFGVVLCLPLFWMITVAIGCFKCAPEQRLQRAIEIHTARPFIAFAVLLSLLAIPALHHEEKYWTSKVDYESLKNGYTVFVPKIEYDYADWLTARTLRHLNELEQPVPASSSATPPAIPE